MWVYIQVHEVHSVFVRVTIAGKPDAKMTFKVQETNSSFPMQLAEFVSLYMYPMLLEWVWGNWDYLREVSCLCLLNGSLQDVVS